MRTKLLKISHAFIMIGLLVLAGTAPASAATTMVTGGTNGASCNSGGYFTPSSVTINSGDTITIKVPANDPYSGGMEVIGFPQGNFDIARGGSFTTAPITANVSYHGTWPNEPACMKGSGTVTVNAPAPSPLSAPPSSGSTGSSGGSASSTPVASPSNKSATSSATDSSTQPATSPTDTDTATPATTTAPASTTKDQPKSNHSNSAAKSPAFKNVAAVGGSGLFIVAIGLFIVWRVLARRRLQVSVMQSSATQLSTPPADQNPVVVSPQNDNRQQHQ